MHYVARHNVTDIDSAQHSAAQHARPMHDRSVQRVYCEFRSVFVHESKANAECHDSCDDRSVGHATVRTDTPAAAKSSNNSGLRSCRTRTLQPVTWR